MRTAPGRRASASKISGSLPALMGSSDSSSNWRRRGRTRGSCSGVSEPLSLGFAMETSIDETDLNSDEFCHRRLFTFIGVGSEAHDAYLIRWSYLRTEYG